jgi:hypothetical protein
MTRTTNEISDQDQVPAGPPEETSPYQAEHIEAGQGAMPAVIRYLPHLIILWSVGYVLTQAESNFYNYIAAVLLVLWSGYHLIAMKKKWPPFP